MGLSYRFAAQRLLLSMRAPRISLAKSRKGAVSVLFASAVITLLMMVGLSVDYNFYNEAQTQLNLAADAASIHAVRMAVQATLQGQTNYSAQGVAAGQQWFLAQAGSVPQAKVVNAPIVTVNFCATVSLPTCPTANLMTATVSYTGVVYAHFGGLFHGTWQSYPNWGIAGTATSVESTQTFIEFDMLLDNSSSMLIASTLQGINQMNAATPCSTAAAGAGQGADGTYTWLYNATSAYGGPNNNSSTTISGAKTTTYLQYGFGAQSYTNTKGQTAYITKTSPPKATVTGECDPGFDGVTTGATNQCAYIPSMTNIVTTNGYPQCATASGAITGGGSGTYAKTGATSTLTGTNMPQAPCAFACHWSATSNDYYGVARTNGITLRFDVIQDASASVVQSLIDYLPSSPVLAPFHIGVYTFNTNLGTLYSSPIWPVGTVGEKLELNTALAAINNYTTPVVSDSADTDFPDSMETLASTLSNAGNGSTAGLARKNLFIVTDGMQDYNTSDGGRPQGPLTVDECASMKNKGYTIYVLYTDYEPLPNYFYLQNDMVYAEPTGASQITTALQACASSPATFFEASSATDIGTAMQTMLHLALSSPGRLSN